MKIQFLSVNGWCPGNAEEDTASYLVNDALQIDTGWHCVRNLMRVGRTPGDVRMLLFTHMHQDHYLSLPQFLFFLLNSCHDASGVSLRGPERLFEVVEQSLALAGKHLHYAECPGPSVLQLTPGDSFDFGDLHIDTHRSYHAAPGLCYRLTDKVSGKSAVFSGDTAFNPEIVEFAKGCDVLIHEQSRGPSAPEGQPNPGGHSTAQDAARCAKLAGVGRLYLIHTVSENREASLRAAREIFPDSYRPGNMEVLTL